jgi:hypothetical protein
MQMPAGSCKGVSPVNTRGCRMMPYPVIAFPNEGVVVVGVEEGRNPNQSDTGAVNVTDGGEVELLTLLTLVPGVPTPGPVTNMPGAICAAFIRFTVGDAAAPAF